MVLESKASRPGAQRLGGLSANGAHVQLASFYGVGKHGAPQGLFKCVHEHTGTLVVLGHCGTVLVLPG